MAAYRIKLFDEHGSLAAQDFLAFADDDEAIDYADHARYPHELHVLRGDTLVARFDPAVPEYL
jgi:hypothetical protein